MAKEPAVYVVDDQEFQLFEGICAHCKNLFFADSPEEQLCVDCYDQGWVFVAASPDDGNEYLFNENDNNQDNAVPF